MADTGDLRDLFEKHRVLVCVGAGGVGKTTVAAALALASAKAGKRTLCLTIDPARRLASSLGLNEFPAEEMQVSSDYLRSHGIAADGRLTVMMLDPRATFDALIRRVAGSEEDANRILSHHVYGHMADSLAGTQAYMAMEKVLSVLNDSQYDLVILDTPPSARALDFFDAPQKMTKILDSPATRALVAAFAAGSGFRSNLVGAGLRAGMKGIERITGGRLLSEMAELLSAMNGLFGGFGERARQVDERLHSSEFGYVLVTAPRRRTIRDGLKLLEELSARRLPIGALVLNRTTPRLPAIVAGGSASEADWRDFGLSVEGQGAARQLLAEHGDRIEQERQLVNPLRDKLRSDVPTCEVPIFAHDVHDSQRLMELAERLCS